MRERPILFSAPMVRALLSGQKTQTRRIVKFDGLIDFELGSDGVWHFRTTSGVTRVPCPYGTTGDRLWVKETWQAQEAFDALSPTLIGREFQEELGHAGTCPVRYLADGKCEGSVDLWQQSRPGKTRVSIHMPRWASRILLEIVSVRVERLNDCSEADALAEGVEFETADPPFYYVPGIWPHSITGVGVEERRPRPAAASYAKLWEHINGAGSWDENPWVWVVEFKRVQA